MKLITKLKNNKIIIKTIFKTIKICTEIKKAKGGEREAPAHHGGTVRPPVASEGKPLN